uniref:Interferon gamma n=1 Tax=Tetraodon nigroviridis TaxID=99883 RepID=H3CLX1_TETNG
MVARVTTVMGWCLCMALCQVKGSYIPADMNRTIQNLLDHYKIPDRERFNGHPIFPRGPSSGDLQAEMIYMSAVLQTYDQLLNQMLQQLPTATPTSASTSTSTSTSLRAQLSYLLKKITALRTQYYRKHEELLKKLQPLGNVQLTSTVVQSKALWELIKVYQEASSLPDRLELLRRRRRQAQVKGH